MAKSLICRIKELEEQQNCDADRAVYKLSDPVAGVNVRRWTSFTPHDVPANLFTGPVDPNSGFPTIPNQAPDVDTVEADFNISGPEDVMEAWGWVTVEEDGFLRDNNNNTGELGEVWIGYCCGTPVLQPGGAQDGIGTGASGTDRFVMDTVPIPAGTHFVYFRGSDFSANQGIDLEYSTNATSGFANLLGWTSEKPKVECEIIGACDEVPEGYSICPPEICDPVITAPPASSKLELCDDIPIADNEADAAIRTGLAGVSEFAARCDHNHPIVRQVNPGAVTLVAGGNFTIDQALTTSRFWSDEESVYFGQRYRVSQPAGTGWGWLTVPNLAGFQRPLISEAWGYRPPSTAIQIDDTTGVQGGNGATPRGPVMNNEISHWSFTQRLYGAYFRRDNPVDMYVSVVLKYIRL